MSMNNDPNNNKHLASIVLEALGSGFVGSCLVDCYNQSVIKHISPTISTGIDFRNEHFIVEIYEIDTNTD